jgi:2-oxoglutarate dehydrogenase E2 component (dihydrolipoamide succinyltransferase)
MEDQITITLPKLGESIVSATVVQWFKKVGDRIERDEALLEVSTDKVNSEIPSPVAGVLQAILAGPDVELQVGEPLGVIASKGVATSKGSVVAPDVSVSYGACGSTRCTHEENNILSPAVLRLLQEKKIPLSDVGKIPRTGQGGRLTKKDVEEYSPLKVQLTSAKESSVERIKMTPLRKAIADNMVKSFYEAPHASLITEVDVTHLVKWIAENKSSFYEAHGAKISVTAFAARAIAKALHAYPLLNSSLDGDTIVMRRFVNLGIAVSVDQSVMVPVLRGCDSLSLVEIAQGIATLAEKARTQTLSPQDVRDGTITLTNFGMTGTMIGVPIIRYPEVAIVGLGAITKKVAVLPDDTMAIRSVMMVSLTFDHRVLDGLYGCGFLGALKKHLEEDV